MITIDDIRNPARVSGFDNVTCNGRRTNWRASSGNTTTANGRTPGWRGPTRKTPEEAAQDYVTFINLAGGVRTQRRALHPRRPSRRARAQRQPTPAEKVAKDIVADARGWRRGQPGWIYLVAEHEVVVPGDFVKIGGTVANPPEQRLGDYQVGNPRRLYMVAAIPGTYADEKELHERYAAERKVGEWFAATDEMLHEFQADGYQ